MDVKYFQSRRPGPEMEIEDVIASQLINIFDLSEETSWVAGSPSIGAGRPDLLYVNFDPEIIALTRINMSISEIITYLKAIEHPSPKALSESTGRSLSYIKSIIDKMIDSNIVYREDDILYVKPKWEKILKEIITIEVKVSNWKRAMRQAIRNSIFAHRSFIAMPAKVALRIQEDQRFLEWNIGLLSVNDNSSVDLLIDSKHRKPIVWQYYYQIAEIIAAQIGENKNELYRSNG